MTALLLLCVAGASTSFVIEDVRVEVGDGSVLESTTVVVRDGVVTSVGKELVPPGLPTVDGRGKVLAPGFIETRSQLGLVEVNLESSTVDFNFKTHGAFTPAFNPIDGFNFNSVRLAINRAEGVTSAVVSPVHGALAGQAVLADLSAGPHNRPWRSAPVALFGNVDMSTARHAAGSHGALWLELRTIFADARYYAQNRAAFDRGDARPLRLHPVHLAALQPLLAKRVPLVLTARRATDILAALRFAQEQGIRLIISEGQEAWMVANDLARARVPVIVQPATQVPATFEALGARDDVATLLHAAGVPVIISVGDSDQNARRLRQEAGIAVSYGLPRPQALAAITGAPAQAFALSDVGLVQEGKRANLVLWSGDPLEIDSVAEAVWIDGVAQPMTNRQEALARRYW